ncbi:MAG: hypothetical protein GMKNLPBB_00535 [Myxococcota bacterium]|nr:hypothetical protein [Myxococcota bacterium]
MKKVFASVLAFAAVGVILTGCGGGACDDLKTKAAECKLDAQYSAVVSAGNADACKIALDALNANSALCKLASDASTGDAK